MMLIWWSSHSAGGGGGGDSDAPLALLGHPVHDGGALMDLTYLVGAARVVEDPLGHGGLTGIDMGNDTDIADALDRILPTHDFGPATGGFC